ncbi:hypothetical protein [Acidimangrovimonas pyrenivorans]|uniref:Lysozyme inhibitor LprI N-terminal domain-containing protein n=1 Tax=Acidimangrovimonas pyrenivorans TaxID=2030798 RepID=A0ABV7AHF6_9RHOB
MVALAAPAAAAAGEAPSPAAECAALWYGRDDYAKRSAYLDADPGGVELARAFRDAAVRLNGGDAAPVDAFIARERRYWALLTESYVYAGDPDSRKLYHDQLDRCDAVAAAQPETRALR